MKIVTVPHPALREPAQPIITVDKKLLKFVEELQRTLDKKKNPPGVGLAAPQVATNMRIFTTKLAPFTEEDDYNPRDLNLAEIRYYINPQVIDHSSELVLGVDEEEPDLEGCLSIPGIYGPVPRWEWIEVEYQQVQEQELITHRERFADFYARVVQHEIDHLDGILFTDYLKKYDLPVYQTDRRDNLVEIDPRIIEIF